MSRRLYTVTLRDEDCVAERYRSTSPRRAAERYARECVHPGVYRIVVTSASGGCWHETVEIPARDRRTP